MKNLIIIAFFGFVAWQGYAKHQSTFPIQAVSQDIAEIVKQPLQSMMQREAADASQFKCDGRTYCSQMASCVEAEYFLMNCPGMKMDGDHDGVPCEQQWC